MKVVALLLVSLFAIPALADSITPPVMSVAFSGVTTAGSFFNSPTDYLIGGSNGRNNGCATPCIEFQVQNGVFTGRSTINFASLAFYNGADVGGGIFGHLGKVSFNPQTDVLSAVFGGKENMEPFIAGNWSHEYWYVVKGTFSENLGTGVGSLNLTSENYIGTTAVPEPETLASLLTGMVAIVMARRRAAKSSSQTASLGS
jgi:hypothetical protein